MSLHINKFVDLIRSTEARGQRDLYMPIRDAKDLQADITRLLTTVEELRRAQTATVKEEPVIQVELTGGSFKST